MQERSMPLMPGRLKLTPRHDVSAGTSVQIGAREHEDPRILRRWERWAPLVRTHAQGVQTGSFPAYLQAFRQKHRNAMITLLRAGVEMRKIERLGIDDPRLTQTDRDALLREIINEQNRG